jgi:uncharacterized membrane protein
MIVSLFYLTLILSILLSALVAGLVFGFAAVVMPGINKLSDRDFLLAFKYMDEVIQNNQLVFMLVWIGSIVMVIGTLILGTLILSGGQIYLLWVASALYLLGVQLPTVRFNIPLNNTLQDLDIVRLSESELAKSRREFEMPWNRWNIFRTLNAIAAVLAWLLLLIQL